MPIVVVTLKDRELQRFIIERVSTTIGRDHRCDIAIDNPALSRHHATIRCHRGMFGVRDEGSANGIFVNGESVQGARLSDGDILSLGKFQFQFQQAGGPDVVDLLPDEPTALDSEMNNPERTMAISLGDLQKMVEQQTSAMSAGRPKGATHSSSHRRPGADSLPPHGPSSAAPVDQSSPGDARPHARDGSGAFSPGSAHPLGGARPSTATPLGRVVQPSKSAKTGISPLLTVVIVGLVGMVGLLSAGLVWALFFR